MKKYIFLIVATCGLALSSHAQIGYGTNNPDPRAVIELSSTDKAFYLPRLTTTQLNAQTAWKEGMMVYNTDSNCVYFRGNTDWECVGTGSAGGADDQKIDTLSLQGDTLQISLEGDGEAVQTVDLSGLKDGDAWGVNGENQTSDIGRTGKVGIGTTTPVSELHVKSSGTGEPLATFEAGGDASLRIIGLGGESYFEIQNQYTDSNAWKIGSDDNSHFEINYGVEGTLNGSSSLSILTNGNVGIGTTSPTEKLDIDGQIRIRAGSPDSNRVLTSIDSTGKAEWRNPTSPAYQLKTLTTSRHIKEVGPQFYTGTTLILEPGRWAIDVTMLLYITNTAGAILPVPNGTGVWFRSTFSESETSSTATSDFDGATLYSTALVGPMPYGLIKGMCIINNTSASAKTYYYWYLGVEVYGTALPAGYRIRNFGTDGWAENTIMVTELAQ